MSDTDYALLVQAVGWIERHAGVDAPDYPGLERLLTLLDNIAGRQELLWNRPQPSQSGSSGLVVHVLTPGPVDRGTS